MKVLLILFLIGLALVEFFYHYWANLQSAPLAEVAPQENSAGVHRPPEQNHHSH